jgi:CheY-like chemotaxis protein
MDIQMPGMSGIEAAKRIREASGPRGATPIVALTAHVLAGTRDEALDAGIQDHVTKPIDPMELAIAINRWSLKPATASAANPVIDREHDVDETAEITLDIEMLTILEEQIGHDTLVELAAIFLAETPGKIDGIRQAVAAGDLPTARRQAHDIRSTAGSMGLRALMSLAREMEEGCAKGRSERLMELAAAIERAYDAAKAPFGARYATTSDDVNNALRAGSRL